MDADQFLDRCAQTWTGRKLNSDQRDIYRTKLYRFTGVDLDKLFDWLVEHRRMFPAIADVYDAAGHLGFLGRTANKGPHDWKESECRLCGGSGQLAVFYEQLFDPKNGRRELTLQRVMQYESSEATLRNNDWTRYFFRCSCSAGEVSTLPKGLPRWSGEQREYMQLPLGAKK